ITTGRFAGLSAVRRDVGATGIRRPAVRHFGYRAYAGCGIDAYLVRLQTALLLIAGHILNGTLRITGVGTTPAGALDNAPVRPARRTGTGQRRELHGIVFQQVV